MARRSFTVDEANALIPLLESIFESIESHKKTVRELSKKVEVLDLLWGDGVRQKSNPDHEAYASLSGDIRQEVKSIQHLIQHEILGRGIRFPVGGIENGLVDFPTTFEGRWVYLCWQFGERELGYWHETHTGFPGRQPITDEHRARMGIEDDPDDVDDSSLDF